MRRKISTNRSTRLAAIHPCQSFRLKGYDHVELDEMPIMPNHIHGIILSTDGCRAVRKSALRKSVSHPP